MRAGLKALKQELALSSFEQSLERERLEVLDHQVTAAQVSLARCMEKANASLATKAAMIHVDANEKIMSACRALAEEHNKKLKLHETHFSA